MSIAVFFANSIYRIEHPAKSRCKRDEVGLLEVFEEIYYHIYNPEDAQDNR